MCKDKIKSWFKKSPKPVPIPEHKPEPLPEPIPEPGPEPEPEPGPLRLLYPEEQKDDTRTLENTDLASIILALCTNYRVPQQYWDFWNGEREVPEEKNEVETKLEECPYDISNCPAATISEYLEVRVNPVWANPGVIAHEYAHISYSLLSAGQKSDFEKEFDSALAEDGAANDFLRLAYETKQYMRFNIIEAYADTFRYLGDSMPDSLKKYYPKLLED